MAFNTAVFYDIENLLKGYAFSAQMLSSLSLREVLESANKTGRLSGIAVQRAYANWSDPRLAVMRGEINELGIEPVQVFGFSRDPTKNAADIQLAIDAIDLAHVRPSIEVFVIVSGDGGFASLAKKLHEYGKTVIGCAYRSAANRVFRAVCDEFVWIPDPDDSREGPLVPQPAREGPQITTPLVVRMARVVKPLVTSDRETIMTKAKEVLRWCERDPSCRVELAERGLHLSVVGEAIRYAVPDIDLARLGFGKFVELLQFLCADTSLRVFRSHDGTLTLASRSAAAPGREALPDLDLDHVHSAENYRGVLARGAPVFRLPDAADLWEVAACVARNPPRDIDLGTAIERVAAALDGVVSSEATKRALLAFVSAGMFDRQPPGLPLGEQHLTLHAGLEDGRVILEELKRAVIKKLQSALGEVREDVVEQIVPPVSPRISPDAP